jgi:hypothetical protein
MKIVITVEGGCVQDVYIDSLIEMEYTVIDNDDGTHVSSYECICETKEQIDKMVAEAREDEQQDTNEEEEE